MHLHAAPGERHGSQATQGRPRVHTHEKFAFTARASMERVAPLFGADKERVWSVKWEPSFIYPLPAQDAQGMVFTVEDGHRTSVWVKGDFDLKNGRVQYA
jgi:hypothetical protein